MGQQQAFDPYYSHWADIAARRVLTAHPDRRPIVVAAGITPSGVVHVGNFREVMTVDLVARALRDQGIPVRFIYSWDDFDVFRKVPADAPEQAMLSENLRRSVADVPDPYAGDQAGDQAGDPASPVPPADSYASHHIAVFEASLAPLGMQPEFIRQSRAYRAGRYAEGIRKALEQKDVIRAVLDQFRTEPLAESWLPLAGFCKGCGRDSDRVHVGRRLAGRDGLPGLRSPHAGRPARRRRREASLADRLADALGVRGRLLRARRQGPQHGRRKLRHGQADRRAGVRVGGARVRPLRLRSHQGRGREDLELGGRGGDGRGLSRGLRARDAALDLREPASELRVPDLLRRRRDQALRGLRPRRRRTPTKSTTAGRTTRSARSCVARSSSRGSSPGASSRGRSPCACPRSGRSR